MVEDDTRASRYFPCVDINLATYGEGFDYALRSQDCKARLRLQIQLRR